MKKGMVDFAAIKAGASFKTVLDHYGIEYREKGSELIARCPLHDETEASFHANEAKVAFNCFGCKEKGNVLDFVVKKERIGVKRAAELVAEWCGIDPQSGHSATETTEQGKVEGEVAEVVSNASEAIESDTARENKQLDITLKLDRDHPYLTDRGITDELADTFDIGYAGSRGIMKGRVAFPIFDDKGDKVAYCGRWPGDDGWPEDEGKYKLPPNFKKSLVVFNLHRVSGADHLILVEGFFSVFRLHQLGYNAVALMGTEMSADQERLLGVAGASKITVLLDGDKAGREASLEIAGRLARHCFVRIVELPDGKQPDRVEEEMLNSIV